MLLLAGGVVAWSSYAIFEANQELALSKTRRGQIEQLQKEEADRIAKEKADRKAQREAMLKERAEARRKAQKEADRIEAQRKAKEETDRKEKEEAERIAKEEAERKAQREEESRMREEAWRKDHPEEYLQGLDLVKKGNVWQPEATIELDKEVKSLFKETRLLTKSLNDYMKNLATLRFQHDYLEDLLRQGLDGLPDPLKNRTEPIKKHFEVFSEWMIEGEIQIAKDREMPKEKKKHHNHTIARLQRGKMFWGNIARRKNVNGVTLFAFFNKQRADYQKLKTQVEGEQDALKTRCSKLTKSRKRAGDLIKQTETQWEKIQQQKETIEQTIRLVGDGNGRLRSETQQETAIEKASEVIKKADSLLDEIEGGAPQ